MLVRAIFVLHLIGFAAYLGAGFAQLQLMKKSVVSTGAMRAELEKMAAKVIVMIEVPAIMLQIATGIAKLVMTPEWLKQGWLHGKLTCVFFLLILSNVEMFNARAIVRLREDGVVESEIEARKKRHNVYGTIGSVLVVLLLGCVTVGLR